DSSVTGVQTCALPILMQSSSVHRIVVWLGVGVLLLWSLGPIYWNLASSITPSDDFSARPIHFFPQHFTIHHYERLLGINVGLLGETQVWSQFRAALWNSVVTSFASTVVCVAMSALGGYAFT